MSADHIHFFLQMRDQIKLYHWQTRVYARHIATDTILHLWRFKMPILMKIYSLYFFNFLLDFLDGFFTYTPSLLYEPINKFL